MLYLPLSVAVLLNLTSIGAFLYLMDYAARLLRPITILWRLGEQGLQVINQIYPSPIKGTLTPSPPMPVLGAPAREIPHRGKSAIILAINSTR